MSLVPAISEARPLKRSLIRAGRAGAAGNAVFCYARFFGALYTAKPTTLVLFRNIEAPTPSPFLLLPWFFSLYTATFGILQGLGQTLDLSKHASGCVIKCPELAFTAVPALHVGGADFSTVAGFLIASYLNIRKVAILTGWALWFS